MVIFIVEKSNIMKKLFLLSLLLQLTFLLSCDQSKGKDTAVSSNESDKLPKVAVAGIAIESSTFSPARTHEEAFHARVGDTVLNYYPFMEKDSMIRNRAEWFPTLTGHALPGGTVTREAYESLLGQTIDMLKSNLPYDGLFLDIHGAMSVVGLDDAEGDFIKRIREVRI